MSRILIAEDEPRIAAFIDKGLRSNGFTPTIAANGRDALELALCEQFELMILDLGLPGKDGLSVLEELRGQGIAMAVIILTGRGDIKDKVMGFEQGADDYLTKPFRFEELLARVRVRLRELFTQNATSTDNILVFGDIELNLHTRIVKLSGRPITLSTREFTLIETFIRHPGQIMSREQLLDHVWGYDYDPGSNIVDVYVGYLRKKLGSNLIETIRSMGYRLKYD